MDEPNRKVKGQQDRQRILDFYAAYKSQHGYMPTHREVAEAIDIEVTRATEYIADLVRKGWLYRIPGMKERNVRLVPKMRGKMYYEWEGVGE